MLCLLDHDGSVKVLDVLKAVSDDGVISIVAKKKGRGRGFCSGTSHHTYTTHTHGT